MLLQPTRLVVLCVALLAWSPAASAVSTITLKAVKKNGTAITPTTSVSACVSDIIEAEFYISDFASELPSGVRAYNFKVAGVAGSQGSNVCEGTILPVGWNRPVPDIPCTWSNDCAAFPPYTTCLALDSGICVGPGHNPTLGAFITTSRPDFMNAGFVIFGGLATNSLNYLYGFTNQENDGNADFGVPYYAGTIKLEVKPGACGTFVWGVEEGSDSFLTETSPAGITTPLHSVPLTITVSGECPPPDITSTDPPVCSIDARYPHDPNNDQQVFGFDRLVLNLRRDPQQTVTCGSNIVMSNVPNSPPFPTCQRIIQNGTQVTVVFDQPVPASKWVCVELHLTDAVAPFDKACIGALPADTDRSRLSEGADTRALMNGLHWYPILQIWQTDIDRSGVFSPLDILASIDLLNGAGAFSVFKGASLQTCPTVGIP